MVSGKVDDEKKNDAKENSNEQTNEFELRPQKKWLKPATENSSNVEPNDDKKDAKSDKEFLEQQLSDETKAELSDGMVHEAVTANFGGDSAVEAEEQQVSDPSDSIISSLESLRRKLSKQISLQRVPSIAKALDDPSDSDPEEFWYDGNKCQKLKGKFEKCFTKLQVAKEDIKQKPYDELCKMLVPPMSLYRERKRFYSEKRAPTESDEEYIKRLTDLSSTCQFGEKQDLMIADKFIVTAMENRMFSSHLRRNKSPWVGLKQEVDSKKALEIAQSEGDPDDIDDFLSPYFDMCGGGKKQSKNIPPHLAEKIRNEIMAKDLSVEWDDIAGLDFAKSIIKESIVWPLLRPDIFTGLRKIPKAMLLFGPPGTGKTMIAKCIAAQSNSTFFYVSASTMASKWHGEAEQLVRALFTIAAEHQPSVIFFDEVDSLLTQRKSEDHEASRRVKTEFMIHLDGAATKDDTRVLFIGATNRPQDLDEAARRRFVKRIFVPLPDLPGRKQLLKISLKNHHSNLTDSDVSEIASMTNEFSGADIKWLCQDAAMEPLRSIPGDGIKDIEVTDIRPLEMYDFVTSLKRIRPSVAKADLTAMVEWDRLYGSNSERPDADDIHCMYT